MKNLKILWLIITMMVTMTQCSQETNHPTIYIIGDSTVKNGQGDGASDLWGWGNFIHRFIDTSKVSVENHARGGTSSRTFLTKGLWTPIHEKLEPGDYVFMQFGHNDGGNINDDFRARGTIRGAGDESQEIDNLLTGEHEVVHTYGWYLKKYISETKAKGAHPVVLSQIPRNRWEDGNVERVNESYGKWAREAAEAENAIFLDLNEAVALKYEQMGPEKVKDYFPGDHTHTNREGAIMNARTVAELLHHNKISNLRKYIVFPEENTP